MTFLLTTLLTLLLSSASFTAASKPHSRAHCQYPTFNPLTGCPPNTLLVHPNSSIQDTILSIPNNTTPYTILILPGTYREQLNITRRAPLTLLGQTRHPNSASKNTVTVVWSDATGNNIHSYDNAYTSTLTVAPNFNASATGSGPTGDYVPPYTPLGCEDFKAYNLNFMNDYAPYSAGPALAVSVSYANASFYYAQVLSYQDTVYIGKIGNTYMTSSIIAGQTDFFYGFGTLWVTDSEVQLRGCGGGITAWKGTNTTFENKYGVYITRSSVVKANASLEIEGECALGRPWNADMRAIFSYDYLDASIRPSGYIEWSESTPRIGANTTLAEFRDFGPGFNLTGRLEASNVTIEMTPEEYEPYSSPMKVFQYPFVGVFGDVAWIDEHPKARLGRWGGW